MPALLALYGPEILMGLGAVIFCLLAVHIAKGLFGINDRSGWFVSILSIVTVPLTKIEQKLVAEMAKAGTVPQQHIGAALHDTARLTDDVAAEVVSQSLVTVQLAQALEGTLTQDQLASATHDLTKRIGNAEAQARGIGADVLPRIKAVERGIGNDVLPQLRELDREVNTIRTKTIPRVAARDRGIADDLSTLWKWAHSHVLQAGTITFAGAVAFALARLGAGWTRCNNWNRIGKQVCGTPLGDIESLLGLFAAGAIIADFRELVKLAQTVEHGVATGLQDIAKL